MAKPPAAESCTDLGNARRLVALHGADLRYVAAWGWLVWDGKRWKRDEDGAAERRAKDTVRSILVEAAHAPDEAAQRSLARHALASQRAGAIDAVLRVARTEPEIAASPETFDQDPWLVTVANGTIDLRTGELRPHDRRDLITKLAPVVFDPAAESPTLEAFVERVLAGDNDLIAFLFRAIGYSLTGDTREQVLFFLYGLGANGKSTLLDFLVWMLGDYAMTADAGAFLERRGDGPRNDIARLAGARLVSASEAGEGRRLDENLVKQLTGDGRMAARFLNREFFEFRPAFKLWLAANHKPVIRGTDHAIWRRVLLLPFTVTIGPAERDGDLPAKLMTEASGAFNWILRGCMQWQLLGLRVPDGVRAATNEYRAEMDTLGPFLEECCELDDGARVQASELFHAYDAWRARNGEREMKQTAFGRALADRGFGKVKEGVVWRLGLRLRPSLVPGAVDTRTLPDASTGLFPSHTYTRTTSNTVRNSPTVREGA